MEFPQNLVFTEGTLNDRIILKKEILLKGTSGRYVERFFLSDAKSFIFKHLPVHEEIEKEIWLYQHVLSSFPDIYPKLISYSNAPDEKWMIYEDLGSLAHTFDEKTVIEVVKWIAWWQKISAVSIKLASLSGQKPPFESILSDIFQRRKEIDNVLPLHGIEKNQIDYLFQLLIKTNFSVRKVLSHGDLHLGNYAMVNKRMVILDWEHAHLNLPYWDLYHLIDMSHPDFPKKVTRELRLRVLQTYLEHSGNENGANNFIQEYLIFSSVFSIWMFFLILKDLKGENGIWSKEQLQNQMIETMDSLQQCLNSLYSDV